MWYLLKKFFNMVVLPFLKALLTNYVLGWVKTILMFVFLFMVIIVALRIFA